MNIDELIAKVRDAAGKAQGGRWTKGKPSDSIVSDTESGDDEATRDHYGGEVICESMKGNNQVFLLAVQPANTLRICNELATAREALHDLAESYDQAALNYGFSRSKEYDRARAALKGGE